MNKKLPIFGIGVGGVSAIMAAIICVNVVSSLVEINKTNQIIQFLKVYCLVKANTNKFD